MNVPGQMPRSSKSILVISCCPLLCCFDAVQMIDACLTGHVFDSFNWMVQKNLKEHNLRILPVVWRWRLRPRWSANRRQPPGVQRLRERDTRQCGCGQLTSAVLSCCVMLSTSINCCVVSTDVSLSMATFSVQSIHMSHLNRTIHVHGTSWDS